MTDPEDRTGGDRAPAEDGGQTGDGGQADDRAPDRAGCPASDDPGERAATRYKPVPEPRGIETLRAVQAAVPLVPEGVEDCCGRLVARTEVPTRDEARDWLPFLVALGLAERTERGFQRVRTDPERDAIADAFERRVFVAAEVLDALAADDPLTVDGAFDALRPVVPAWERERHPDWEREWRDRTRRLLEWGVALGRVERDGERFRRIGPL